MAQSKGVLAAIYAAKLKDCTSHGTHCAPYRTPLNFVTCPHRHSAKLGSGVADTCTRLGIPKRKMRPDRFRWAHLVMMP
jgi:hypothetical protein